MVSEATGQHSLLLTLTNTSPEPCFLDGYPGIVLSDANDRPLPFTYHDGGDQMITARPPTMVPLAPEGIAYLMINKYRCDLGDKALAASVKVAAPGEGTTLSLSWGPYPIMAHCGPTDPGSVLDVSPIEPTAQALFKR